MADSNAGLMDMLAGWLPQQRWFPGRGRPLSELAIISDVTLRAGNPALRHLIVEAHLRSGPAGDGPGGPRRAGSRCWLATARAASKPRQCPDRVPGWRGLLRRPARSGAGRRAPGRHRGAADRRPLRFVREPGAAVLFGPGTGQQGARRGAEQHQPGLRRPGDTEGPAPPVSRRQPGPGSGRRPGPAGLGPGGGALRLD